MLLLFLLLLLLLLLLSAFSQKTASIPFPYAPKRPHPCSIFAHRPHTPNSSILMNISSDLVVSVTALSRHALAIALDQPRPVADPIPNAPHIPVSVAHQPLPHFSPSDIDIGSFLLSLSSFGPPGVAGQLSARIGPEYL